MRVKIGRITLTSILTLELLVIVFVFKNLDNINLWASAPAITTSKDIALGTLSAFEKNLEPLYADPLRLYSENGSLDVPLIEVGLEEDGTLESPDDWYVGGWYKKSAKPGSKGNTIIDGHYDNNFGQPAAFWGLKNLDLGDKVYVVDAFGKSHTYQVVEKSYVDIFDSERLEILRTDSARASLTLITCGGVWLPAQGTYDKRLVVKAEGI